jgi:excisionase family DNA binding protein
MAVTTEQGGSLGGMNGLTIADHHRRYLTVAEVAHELGCSEPTVRRRIRAGELLAVQLGGRGSPVRIPRQALEDWLYEESHS